jgi:subtilisin-like proprotein convertase family protein
MNATSPLLSVLPVVVALFLVGTAYSQETPRHLIEKDRTAASLPDSATPRISSELLIQFKPGTDVQEFALRRGLTIKQTLRSDPNMHVLKAVSAEAAQQEMAALYGVEAVQAAYFNLPSLNVRTSFTPNDPYYNAGNPTTFPGQWHLVYDAHPDRDSNIRAAWLRNLTGSGVIVGICDDGVETAHPDLAPNYVANLSYDFADNDLDPNPVFNGFDGEGDNHGTSVAGVAAARGGNGIGVTGAAPLARIAALRLPFQQHNVNNQHAFVDVLKYNSFGNNRSIRVKNHSYGVSSPFVPNASERDAVAESAMAGTIHVLSAGNDRDKLGEDSNKKAFQNSPHVINVAALASSGLFSSYSCFGANVFVTAPSSSFRSGEFGITTTDRSGSVGYNPGARNNAYPDRAYTSDFGGTSSSAPLVAGIMALGVEANTNLNVRMAKHLLARTSRVIDLNDNSATSDGGWKTNAAGFAFNPNHGFGLIDAAAFTLQAPQFSGVTPLEIAETPLVAVGAAIPDAGQISRTFTVNANTPLEEVEIFLDIQHSFRGDVETYVTSPRGTTSRLFIRNGTDEGSNINWWFTSNAYWGEDPSGTWTITVHDFFPQDTGTWNSFRARVRMGELIPADASSPPTLTGFTPTSGPASTVVTINGTKFSDVSAVTFNGVSAVDFTVHSGTQIRATVPAGAATGPIRVITTNGTATSSANFEVTAAPAISSFIPSSGPVGTTTVIAGANFTGATEVTFNNQTAVFTLNSANQITATVPAGATTGRITVTTPAGTATSSGTFAISSAPVIAGFNPATGPAGTLVIINGANLNGATAVRFNSVNATFTAESAVQITAIVPPGAGTGPISVTTPNGTAQSAGSFTIAPPPTISNIVPGSGAIGTVIAIGGNHFTGATAVQFSGVNTSNFSVVSASQISAVVPPGATDGPVTVVTPSGSVNSTITFQIIAAAANDDFAGAQTIAGNEGSAGSSNASASKQPGEPNHAGNPGGKSVWFQWTAPSSGTWVFDTYGSGFDTLLAVYIGSTLDALTLVAENDDSGGVLQSRVAFSAMAGTVYRIAVDGLNSDPTSPLNAVSGNITLNWTEVATAPIISNFTPNSGPPGTLVMITGTHFAGTTAVSFNNVDAANFSIVSDTQISAIVPEGADSGPIRVSSAAGVTVSSANFMTTGAPSNDSFANAQPLSGNSGTITGTNNGATKENGEPNHAGNIGGSSVWYTWTAPASGKWTFDTAGSNFDTLLAVYIGSNIGSISLIASNDDAGVADRTSRLSFDAISGTVYRIAVDGYIGLAGAIRLNWSFTPNVLSISAFDPPSGLQGTTVAISGQNFSGATAVSFNGVNTTFTVQSASLISATVPAGATTGPIRVSTSLGTAASSEDFVISAGPLNDHFAAAQVLTGIAAVTRGSSLGATRETGEPDHAGGFGSNSVWYRWTAPSAGAWGVDTSGSDFDTVVGVYTGTAVNSLTLVAQDDDSGEGFASRALFNATEGTTYHIAVDGYDQDSGQIALRLYPFTEGDVLFSTGFEPWENYNGNFILAGQNSWESVGSGGNGLTDGSYWGLGQSAFIGFFPPTIQEATYIFRPINHVPNTSLRPVLYFSVWMEIVDSTNFRYDEFEWAAFNRNGDFLFALNFDNNDLNIYTRLNDGAGYTLTGDAFINGMLYHLGITMDFARNRWEAALNGEVVVQDQPISTTSIPLDLGDISAVWVPGSFPGNNYMLFDGYEIFALGDQAPHIWVQPESQSVIAGSELFLAVGASGDGLVYDWRRDGQVLDGQTQPFIHIPEVGAFAAGVYVVEVRNAFGAVTSSSATVSVGALTPERATLSVSTLAGGRFHLGRTGTPGVVYRVEASSDLVTWNSVATLSSPSGVSEFTETVVFGTANRFYRVVTP